MTANVTITQLPAAGAITGSELVPIVQNGVTKQTTTGAIAASPSQTQTFLTVNQELTLPNSRYLSTGTGLGLTDGGATSFYRITLNGASGSLESAGNGLIAKTAINTIASRTFTTTGTGLDITNPDGVAGNPIFSLSGLASSFANLAGSGLVFVNAGANAGLRQLAGTTNQIDVANTTGVTGNPTVSIANNPIVPGLEGIVLPSGTTGNRPGLPTNGTLRYNTQTGTFEGYANNAWGAITTGTGVTSIVAGTGLTGGTITSTGTIAIDNTVVATLTDTQTLTNKTISGADNTLSNISLASSVTGTLPIANGGTGTTSTTFVDLTANVSGILPIANGGTGTSTAGVSATIVTAKLTALGADGSMTFTNGLLTAQTPAT